MNATVFAAARFALIGHLRITLAMLYHLHL
jgi:hypothetical protein